MAGALISTGRVGTVPTEGRGSAAALSGRQLPQARLRTGYPQRGLLQVVRAGDFTDPDELRRIRENKQWKRDDPAEEVWDIDKERAAVTYKKEALEAMFRMPSAAEEAPKATEEPAKSYLCGACGSPVASALDATAVEGAHRHVLSSASGPVVVVVFADTEGTLDTADPQGDAPAWAKKRQSWGCSCAACKAQLGWSYIATTGDEGDFKALQLTRLRPVEG